MSERHSVPIRGLMSAKTSPLLQGRFGRMFRSLPHAKFGATDKENVDNLAALGSAMSAPFDPPKDGKDDEESGIPALYTYLGQFIDHDITFDPASSPVVHGEPIKLTSKASFSAPGTYVLRAIAFDGQLFTTKDVTVTVNTDQR